MIDSTVSCAELEVTDADLRAALSTWQCYARPDQLVCDVRPRWYNQQKGRGNGKTRSAVEYAMDLMEDFPGIFLGCASQTYDATHRDLVNGPGGFLRAAALRGIELVYRATKPGLIRHPSGAEVLLGSGEVPRSYRGPQYHFFWCDELGYWQDPEEAFQTIDDSVRLTRPGLNAHGWITCTPNRRQSIGRMLRDNPDVITVYGDTYSNRRNLDRVYVESRERAAGGKGTSRYKQEILGELLDDGSAFTESTFNKHRVLNVPTMRMDEVVIGHDPAVTSGEDSDEHGIVAVAREGQHAYVLEDASVKGSDMGGGDADDKMENALAYVLRKAMHYRDLFKCKVRIIVEINQGGDLWGVTYRNVARKFDLWMPEILTVRANDAKIERADAANLHCEMGLCHLVGVFPTLEKQCTTWMPNKKKSPDRMDAFVHALLLVMTEQHGSLLAGLE